MTSVSLCCRVLRYLLFQCFSKPGFTVHVSNMDYSREEELRPLIFVTVGRSENALHVVSGEVEEA